MTAPLSIGLDAGGTKTALLARSGSREVSLSGPGAHALRDGAEGAADRLAELVREACREAGGAPAARVVAGVAGAGREAERAALQRAFAERLGAGVRVEVVHDAAIALDAAWGEGSGAVLVVGTGSVLFARDEDGRTLRAGGWGHALGDDGSGTALGRAALRAVLAAHDGGPPTALADAFAEQDLATPEAILRAVYVADRPLASFAPTLLGAVDSGDWVAEQALMRETNAVGQQAGWLATRAAEAVSPRVALVGGLVREAAYRQRLLAALERHLPGWTVEPDPPPPVAGALRRAEALT